MTALVGAAPIIKGRSGERGTQYTALLKYTLLAALVNADTITWSNCLPNGKFRVVGFEVWGVELDTHGTPTMLFTVGDGVDADGYKLSASGAIGLQNSLAGQLFYKGDGALIGTTDAANDVVLTVTAAVATGATSGDIWIEVVLEGI